MIQGTTSRQTQDNMDRQHKIVDWIVIDSKECGRETSMEKDCSWRGQPSQRGRLKASRRTGRRLVPSSRRVSGKQNKMPSAQVFSDSYDSESLIFSAVLFVTASIRLLCLSTDLSLTYRCIMSFSFADTWSLLTTFWDCIAVGISYSSLLLLYGQLLQLPMSICSFSLDEAT